MKKLALLLFVLAGFLTASAQSALSFHPYMRAGLTLLPPSLEDLDYVGLSGEETQKDLLLFGLGLQLKTDLGGTLAGLDIGAGSLFVNRIIYDQGVGISYHTDSEMDVYITAFAERKLNDIFFYQVGMGPHFLPWYYTYYYESNSYSDVYDEYGGLAVKFGINGALGTDMKLTETIGLYCTARVDMIFQYGIILPVSITAGLNFGR